MKIEGDFEPDDIVKIIDSQKKQVGVGRIAFDNKVVEKLIGKSNEKPIIHYDYLYIDK